MLIKKFPHVTQIFFLFILFEGVASMECSVIFFSYISPMVFFGFNYPKKALVIVLIESFLLIFLVVIYSGKS